MWCCVDRSGACIKRPGGVWNGGIFIGVLGGLRCRRRAKDGGSDGVVVVGCVRWVWEIATFSGEGAYFN